MYEINNLKYLLNKLWLWGMICNISFRDGYCSRFMTKRMFFILYKVFLDSVNLNYCRITTIHIVHRSTFCSANDPNQLHIESLPEKFFDDVVPQKEEIPTNK